MQYRLPLLMLLTTVFIGNLHAQHQATTFKIYFNVNDHSLDKDDEAILDALVTATQKSSYYEIGLTAHTDSDAETQYNIGLSERRATAVKNYLLAHQVKPKALRSSFYGESRPETTNASEAGKAANRRVEITLNSYVFNSAGDVLKHASPSYKQEFTINATKANTIKAKNGTTISIPANAMQTKNGKPVTGDVNIVVQEFLKPCDAAFNQLSTMSNGRLLESGGMFSIQAYADGEEVQLKKNSSMRVNMPTINMKNNMTLFTAVQNTQGVTEWKPTNVPFRPNTDVAATPPPSVKLNTDKLKKMMVDCPAPVAPEFEYTLPALPKRPENIGKRPEYRAPVYEQTFAWWKRILYPRKKLERQFDVITQKSLAAYQKRLTAYEKRAGRLQPLWDQYLKDSAALEQEHFEALRTWLAIQQERHEAYGAYMEKQQWNQALQMLISQSDNHALNRTDMKERFLKEISIIGSDFYIAYTHYYAARVCADLSTKSMLWIVSNCPAKTALSLHISNAKRTRWVRNPVDLTFAQQQLNEHQELLTMLDIAQKDLVKKMASAREFNESNVGNIYATSLSSFGTFNCDRFYNTPENMMVTIRVPHPGEARVAFFVPKLNSYMYANRDDLGYTARLPKDLKIKVIFVSYNKEDGPVLQIEQASYNKNTTIQLKPRSVTLAEMQKELAAI
jgi:hypothetical protein